MHVKIADFGLATRPGNARWKTFHNVWHSELYFSRDRHENITWLGSWCWSLGCMLYTFLVGRPPFDTDAVKSTLDRVIQAEYDLPDHLSPEAKDLIQLLLRKNPKERVALSDIPKHPFMKKRYPVSYKQLPSQNYVEASLDSGQGTMSTEIGLTAGLETTLTQLPDTVLYLVSPLKKFRVTFLNRISIRRSNHLKILRYFLKNLNVIFTMTFTLLHVPPRVELFQRWALLMGIFLKDKLMIWKTLLFIKAEAQNLLFFQIITIKKELLKIALSLFLINALIIITIIVIMLFGVNFKMNTVRIILNTYINTKRVLELFKYLI